MSSPVVSVIVPNYNHKAFLEQRLESILNQTFQDFELILLDDYSTDGSKSILEKYKNHSKVTALLYNTVNTGKPILQWEKGIECASGDYIWIAESDDYCDFSFLEKMVGFLENRVDLGLAYSQSLDVDEKGNTLSHRLKYTENFDPNIWKEDFVITGIDFIHQYLKVKNVIPNASAVLFKKSLVDSLYFKSDGIKDLHMCADWLFWIRVIQNAKIGFLNQELNYFRNHVAVTRNHSDIEKQKKRVLEEVVIRKYLSKMDNLKQLELWIQVFRKWLTLSKSVLLDNFKILKILKSPKLIMLYSKVLFEVRIEPKLKSIRF
ncbi:MULTISPECIES: glycosyltransferase family 2 protein [unclassified Leeuwenhoekiella]|uniref:glycosyltransferase family 2 protein n=1 Tax=unclassified Leeuwenhoekiella TaxID=2615029 RepID=UPI000C56968F|nr:MULTISPECIES: glycosyltransferase family 2 protein [unclassified Leeuwenhoekiella]MAW96653.1 glycosyltransferase [Leeuwenhoekiella sp.]MBA81542.1 glycosyltransferase [Leeuwenhoekiella sp.]|tara:strand:+ start:20474 stop:21430 length:957 start_codon:yes stop_codon:yes gene_type:complete